ncbi:hypothetical protein ACEW7V_01100 [Areca yellow leaf disease phytoplasma]
MIIGSSVNLGAGLALASKMQNKKEVTIANYWRREELHTKS